MFERNLIMSIAAALLAAAALGTPAVQAEDIPSGCVATDAAPHCVFTCPSYGIVKVAVHGPGDEGRIQGGIACGTPPGESGYVKGMTVVCHDDAPPTGGITEELNDLVWDTVYAPLDDGECSAEMTNDGDGPIGQCWLVAGAKAVCSVEWENPLGV